MCIQLSGVNMDPSLPSNYPMQRITIITLPSTGLLFQFNVLLNSTTTRITTVPADLTGAFTVCYTTNATIIDAITDSFNFTATCNNVTSSNNGFVQVVIRGSLSVQPVVGEVMEDHTAVHLTFLGASIVNEAFQYILLTLPEQGELISTSGAVITTFDTSSAPLNAVTTFPPHNISYYSDISLYAGRYNRSLDPTTVTFMYTIIDVNLNRAKEAMVTITFMPIHHAPLVSFVYDELITNISLSTADNVWTIIPSSIVDLDALAGSVFSSSSQFPFQYEARVVVLPLVGAMIRLDPSLNAAIQVGLGNAAGSTFITFSGTFADVNAALNAVTISTTSVDVFNVTVTITQEDTLLVATAWMLVNAVDAETYYLSKNNTNTDTNANVVIPLINLSGIYSWLFIAGCGLVMLSICFCYFRYRKRSCFVTNVEDMQKSSKSEKEYRKEKGESIEMAIKAALKTTLPNHRKHGSISDSEDFTEPSVEMSSLRRHRAKKYSSRERRREWTTRSRPITVENHYHAPQMPSAATMPTSLIYPVNMSQTMPIIPISTIPMSMPSMAIPSHSVPLTSSMPTQQTVDSALGDTRFTPYDHSRQRRDDSIRSDIQKLKNFQKPQQVPLTEVSIKKPDERRITPTVKNEYHPPTNIRQPQSNFVSRLKNSIFGYPVSNKNAEVEEKQECLADDSENTMSERSKSDGGHESDDDNNNDNDEKE